MNKLITIAFILGCPLLSIGQIFNPIDTAICKGGNTSFKSGSIYPSPSYQWQIKHNGTWSDLSNTAPFSGVTTVTLRLTNVSDTLDKDSFKCKVYFNSNLVGISKAARLTVFGGSTLPTSVFATVNPVDCPGGATQLSHSGGSLSSGSSWKWYQGVCGKNAVSSSVNPNATTIYYVRAEGPCKDTTACTSVTVIVTNTNSATPASVSAGPDTICSGKSSTLTIIGGVLGSGAQWKWYSGGTCAVLIDSAVTSISVSPTTTTAYSVKADGKCGSTICKSVNVTVNQLPVVNVGNDTAICLGTSMRLKPSVTGTNTYRWSPSIGLDDTTILSPKASPLNTTTYTLTVTNAKQCVSSNSVTVKVNLLPSAVVGNDTTICEGGTAQLFASGGIAYQWLPVDGLDFPNKSNPLSTVLKTTKYKVKVTDQNLCSDSTEVQVVVNPVPQIKANNDTAICPGNSVKLHSEGGIIYNWSPGTGLDFTNIAEPKASPAVSMMYSVIVVNADGCLATDSVMITVKPLPNVNAGSDKTICLGDSVQLNTTSGTGYGFSWTPAASLLMSNTRTPMAHPDRLTTYHVVVNLDGCTSTDSVRVSVLNGPAPVFTLADSVVCKNASLAEYCLFASSHDFRWSVVNGTIMSGQGTYCIKVHWSATASSGSVTVRDSLQGTPSCPVDVSVNVKIAGGPAPSPITVKAKGNNISTGILLCENTSFNFYQWGLEHKFSQAEQNRCSGDTFCSYSGGIDTLNYDYWVKVGDDIACMTKSYFDPKAVNIFEPSKSSVKIVLYPNPVSDKLTIESSSDIQSVTISNLFGQIIYVQQSGENGNSITLDMAGLSRAYILSV